MAERFNSDKDDSLEGLYARLNPGLNSENQSMDNIDRQNVNALMLATIKELVCPSGVEFSLDMQRNGKNRAILERLSLQQDLPSTQFSKLALDSLEKLDIFPANFQILLKQLSRPKKPFSKMYPEV